MNDSMEFLCRVHNTDVRVSWRAGKPDDAVVFCPLCVAEDYKKARTELKAVREQRDSLLACIDLKRTLSITANLGAEQ